jgi:hypothetical protein
MPWSHTRSYKHSVSLLQRGSVWGNKSDTHKQLARSKATLLTVPRLKHLSTVLHSQGGKLTTHPQLVPRSRTSGSTLRSRMQLHCIMLNLLSTGTPLPFWQYSTAQYNIAYINKNVGEQPLLYLNDYQHYRLASYFKKKLVPPKVNKKLVVLSEKYFCNHVYFTRPPLWSCGQSSWLQIQRSRVQFPALPDFLRSSGSGTGSTQPREDNSGATSIKK